MQRPSPEEFTSLFEPLSNVDKEEIQYLIDESECIDIKEGEFLFEPEQPTNYMYFIMSGRIEIYATQNGQKREFGIVEKGSISGILPYSRMEKARGYANTIEDSKILAFPRAKMPELIRNHYSLTEALVHHMSSRIREFTKYQQQNEKMMALGKLSAGLAHELNNPASAIVRSSKELQKQNCLLWKDKSWRTS
jgi:CRP-like cAMP-binding protein